jgi:FtsH-binding integral membrane protein
LIPLQDGVEVGGFGFGENVMRSRLVPILYGLGIALLVLSLVVDIFVKSEALYLGVSLAGAVLCSIAAFFIAE